MSDQGKPRDDGDAARAPGGANAGVRQYYWKRRSRASTDATHGRGSALLASTSDLNFGALDIRESFERLAPAQRVRLYHATRAVCEAQKIAFLQASAESPLILLLFQELFCSPEEDTSPGELILELQNTCFANGLGDAIANFFKYVALFYHNYGNYDLLSGEKIIPEIQSFEFENIVRSSRAFAQRRGLRLKRAMDACIDAIYRPAVTTSEAQARSSSVKEATVVVMNESQSYPFYGQGVSYLDIVRVDRELDKHGIIRINTRVIKEVDRNTVQRATFHIFQASMASAKTESRPTTPLVQQEGLDTPSQVIIISTRDEIQVHQQDFGYYLSKIANHLLQAVHSEPSQVLNTLQVDQFKLLVDKTLALWSTPSSATWNDMHHFWRAAASGGRSSDTDFLFSYSLAPSHRDPTGSRGTFEGFVTVKNPHYQRLTDRLLGSHSLIDKVLLPVLPFSKQMTQFRQRLSKIHVACVDLVLSSGCGGTVPVARRLRSDGVNSSDDDKLLFISNCAESYWEGHMTTEKRLLLDGLFSAQDARNVQEQWDRVLYLRFILEDVLAPCTAFILQDGDDLSEVVLLPAELYVYSSDDEDEAFVVEDDSDPEDDQDNRLPPLCPSDQEQVWRESSFARYPTQVYRRKNDSYASRFHGQLATSLEQCRVMLTGLLWALDDCMRQEIFREPPIPADAASCELTETVGEEALVEDPRFREMAVAYVLVLIRDGILALPFFSTQQFRWEDDKMLGRYMVLQMLLCGEAVMVPPSQEHENDDVVQIQATVERRHRDMTDIALGVDEDQVVALQVVLNTTTIETHNGHRQSWRHRLKIRVRTWLQEVQWIQMTGDVESGQQLYQRLAQVSDESLRYRHFLMAAMGDRDMKRREDEVKAGGRGGSSNMPNAKTFTGRASTTEPSPFLPTPSMGVRQKLLAIRNASCFSRDTIWIAPFLRVAGELRVPENSGSREKQENISDRSSTLTSDNAVLGDAKQGTDDPDLPNAGGENIPEATQNAPQQPNHPPASVELRVFPADLTFAIESAVLNIGVISDEEAARGFGVVKSDRLVDQAR